MSSDSRIEVIPGLTPVPAGAPAISHPLQASDSPWPEKNCYIDLWIGILQSLRLEPRAMLPLCLAVDFEGDQWTFFKPSFDELRSLYGIDVQELTLWRATLDHVEEHLRGGKLVTLEADAWWLPDTASTDYRQQHTKTTIGINGLDRAARRLDYFHNAGYFTLEGEDFDQLFRQAQPQPIGDGALANLAPYAETVRLDRLQRRPEAELRAMARTAVARHLARRASGHPVQRFADRWAADLPALQEAGLAHYHRWAFSNLRQLGAAAELAGAAVAWCWPDEPHAAIAAEALGHIATGTKALILKGARSVALKRGLDVQQGLLPSIQAWETAMNALESCPSSP